MNVTFYTIGCPQCRMLETQLKNKDVKYVECNDVEKMIGLGIKHAPALEIDGKILNVQEALKWVKSL